MFTDIELKINYHKERIIKSFIKKGIYPSNSLISTQLNRIETRLSIFKSPKIKEGSLFNTKEINNALSDIQDDLVILYKLLYVITYEEMNKLSYYINTHIRELEDVSDLYLKKANLESYTTALGKTIFFKHNDFTIDKNDMRQVISLGGIEIEDASRIACMADINNVSKENVIFEFSNGTETYLSNLYEYNRSTLLMPGSKRRLEHIVEFNKSQIINGLVELPIAAGNINESTFITLGGKDKILYKKASSNGDIIEEKPLAINALNFDDHTYIDFYVVGGTSISFRFNKKPLSCNFDYNAGRIENLDYIHHFSLECDAGFSFEFEIDKGSIYAVKENTIVDNDALFYSGYIDVREFDIIQTLRGEKKQYDLKVYISNSDIDQSDVNSILIKKIE